MAFSVARLLLSMNSSDGSGGTIAVTRRGQVRKAPRGRRECSLGNRKKQIVFRRVRDQPRAKIRLREPRVGIRTVARAVVGVGTRGTRQAIGEAGDDRVPGAAQRPYRPESRRAPPISDQDAALPPPRPQNVMG